MKDLLLKEFVTKAKRPLAARLAQVFDQHLDAEDEVQEDALRNELERVLEERTGEAAKR